MIGLPSERHLRVEGLVQYLSADVPTLVPIDGYPPAALSISPRDETVALRVQTPASDLPDLTNYEHFDASHGSYDGVPWSEVRVSGRELLLDAYPLLCLIADRVQLEEQGFRSAVTAVLGSFKELLRGLGRLSDQEEVGLFGELLVLQRLSKSIGVDSAVVAWRGAELEEHDFGLELIDVEVKTTVAEDRRHRVSTLSQLEPTEGRELFLVSVQLTTAGLGGSTLPDVVERIRSGVENASTRDKFEALLASAGYLDAHASVYTRRFRLRTAPLAFVVAGDFPSITRPRLLAAGVAVERVHTVTYVIDLDGVPPTASRPELDEVLAGGQDDD